MATNALTDGTIKTFHEQLLKVSSFGSVIKDPGRFPNFTPALAPVLQNEARLFLEQLLVKQGAAISEVLTASFTFVNDQTAPFYGLMPRYGATMTRVDLNPAQRAGILTQVGFLSYNGGLTQSDPIHRGVSVNFNLLCNEVKPPPDMVPALPLNDGQSNRRRIDQHTRRAARLSRRPHQSVGSRSRTTTPSARGAIPTMGPRRCQSDFFARRPDRQLQRRRGVAKLSRRAASLRLLRQKLAGVRSRAGTDSGGSCLDRSLATSKAGRQRASYSSSDGPFNIPRSQRTEEASRDRSINRRFFLRGLGGVIVGCLFWKVLRP